jgi:hypothetical protein
LVRGVRMENDRFVLDGYPDGAVAHGIDGVLATEFRRLAVFRSELKIVGEWLSRIPVKFPLNSGDQVLFEALADAAIIAFSRCFDSSHPLKPLKAKRIFTIEQRDQLDRLRAVRNKLVAHDEHLTTGVFNLIVKSKELKAIEAVSMILSAPFLALPELRLLRTLSERALAWVDAEHENMAGQIVKAFDAWPLEQRGASLPFSIKFEERDQFGSANPRVAK